MSKPAVRPVRWHMVAALTSLALVTGCGGGSTPGSTPNPAPTAAPTPAPTATPTPTPTPSAPPASSFLTSEYNRSDGPAQHGAVTAWVGGHTGQGVTIGIVDSGIDTASPEFAGRISAASADVIGVRGLVNADSDHGTNVAMVAAAARDNTGVMGIAFNATVAMFRADTPGTCATYDAKVKDSGCKYDDIDIAAGMDRAVAAGAKVINLSLGGSPPSATLVTSVQKAAAAGVVIVVSAGNNGDSTNPADNPNNPDPFAAGLRAVGNGNVIIAGSVGANNTISAFSNRAGTDAAWYLMARGDRVCCVYKNGVLEIITNPDGTRAQLVFSGTSFSAPQIAGAVALVRQAFPNLTAQQVVDLLLRTARDAGATGTDPIYGRGILDISAAFAPQGATSIAGTSTVVALGTAMAIMSPAMGDAATQASGFSTIVLDDYNRAYLGDLSAGVKGAQPMQRLASALAANSRHLNFGTDQLSLAFTVDGSGRNSRLPWTGQLRISADDTHRAGILAAQVIARLNQRTTIAFGLAQGTDGLVAQVQGRSQPAFLIARSPLDDTGFAADREISAALRHQLGSWGLTASADSARVVPGASLDFALTGWKGVAQQRVTRFGLSLDRQFGDLALAAGASWMSENRSVLGANLTRALGGHGADTAFLDLTLGWDALPELRLGAAWRYGLTNARAGGTLAAGSRFASNAWALDIVRSGLFRNGDSLAFRFSQPLRVSSGGLRFNLPVAYSYQTLTPTLGLRELALVPKGQELDWELAWHGALLNGNAGASLFYRRNPSHYAALPDDKGLALIWNKAF